MRGDYGSLRAFLNVCRHRGSQLCQGSGSVSAIRCPYHAWSYGLDGRLLATPNVRRGERLPRERLGLHEVRLDVWEGFVWVVRRRRRVATLTDQLRGSGPAIDPFQCERYRARRACVIGVVPRVPRSPRTGRSSSRTTWSACTARASTRSWLTSCRSTSAVRSRNNPARPGAATSFAKRLDLVHAPGPFPPAASAGPGSGRSGHVLRSHAVSKPDHQLPLRHRFDLPSAAGRAGPRPASRVTTCSRPGRLRHRTSTRPRSWTFDMSSRCRIGPSARTRNGDHARAATPRAACSPTPTATYTASTRSTKRC